MNIIKGQPLFSIKQGNRIVQFLSPVSGQVKNINHELTEDLEALDFTPYEKNWICSIDADKLDSELTQLKIGKNAVVYYQEEIDRYIKLIKELVKPDSTESFELQWGQLEKLDEKEWYMITGEFFKN
jgi:Na+-translocating ferredoxin:NAD+ oxidoreductase RnfC subunit